MATVDQLTQRRPVVPPCQLQFQQFAILHLLIVVKQTGLVSSLDQTTPQFGFLTRMIIGGEGMMFFIAGALPMGGFGGIPQRALSKLFLRLNTVSSLPHHHQE